MIEIFKNSVIEMKKNVNNVINRLDAMKERTSDYGVLNRSTEISQIKIE
jgi:hypothetical protein